MPKGKVDDPITDQEIAFAHLILAGKLTDREAAEAVGISPGQAAYVKGKPRVREYMKQHRASVRAGLVQHEVDALAPFNIGREQILAKLWEFANIDPAKTGYNTSSQSKALDYLWNAMGYADSDPKKPDGEDEGNPKPQIYVAKWMRKPGDPGYQDEEDMDAGVGVVSAALSGPEPAPKPATPAVVPQPPTVCPGGRAMNHTAPNKVTPHAVDATELPYSRPGASFGRFQRLFGTV